MNRPVSQYEMNTYLGMLWVFVAALVVCSLLLAVGDSRQLHDIQDLQTKVHVLEENHVRPQ